MKFGPGTLIIDGKSYECSSFEITPQTETIDLLELQRERLELTLIAQKARQVGLTATVDIYTRQQDAAFKEQARRNKRPAWKTPYGPQRR